MRVLYVAGEVAPFSEVTETAQLLRVLPEAVQETQGVEPRIMMPRYGVVSERKNRLHEVIRLSGAVIPVGELSDTLKVKVASIPGIRLQVYFMDAVDFFKRKGLHRLRKDGPIFEDNPARALFYARAALSTADKLGWNPDIVHASGWIASLVPHVIKTELAESEQFGGAKTVFTPDVIEGFDPTLSAEEAKSLGLPAEWADKSLREIGLTSADAAAYAGTDEPHDGEPEGVRLSLDPAESSEVAAAMYSSLNPTAEG